MLKLRQEEGAIIPTFGRNLFVARETLDSRAISKVFSQFPWIVIVTLTFSLKEIKITFENILVWQFIATLWDLNTLARAGAGGGRGRLVKSSVLAIGHIQGRRRRFRDT